MTHLLAIILQLCGIHSFQTRFCRLALAPPAANAVQMTHRNTVFMFERTPLLHLRTISYSHKLRISSHVQNVDWLSTAEHAILCTPDLTLFYTLTCWRAMYQLMSYSSAHSFVHLPQRDLIYGRISALQSPPGHSTNPSFKMWKNLVLVYTKYLLSAASP